MAGVIPTCLALILCDRVGRFRGTRKASPVGVFTAFDLRRIPGSTPSFTVWVQAENAAGPLLMSLVFERALPDRPAFKEELTIRFTMKFKNSNLVAEHANVFEDGIDVTDEGLYRLRLEVGGATIMSRHFVVRRVP